MKEKGIEEEESKNGLPSFTQVKAKVTFAKPKPKQTSKAVKSSATDAQLFKQMTGNQSVEQKRKEERLDKQLVNTYGKNALKMIKLMGKGSSKRFKEEAENQEGEQADVS